jgi:hypothetical protein
MPPITDTFAGDDEKRLRRLEAEIADLRRRAQNAEDAVGQLQQDQAFSGAATPTATPAGGFAAVTGSGGLTAATAGSAMGSGTITLYDPAHFPSLVTTGSPFTAYSTVTTAVGGSKDVQGKIVGGFYLVDTESC